MRCTTRPPSCATAKPRATSSGAACSWPTRSDGGPFLDAYEGVLRSRGHDFDSHGLRVLHVHVVARRELANEAAAFGRLDRERMHHSILTTERDSVERNVDGLDLDGRRDRLAGRARQMLTLGCTHQRLRVDEALVPRAALAHLRGKAFVIAHDHFVSDLHLFEVANLGCDPDRRGAARFAQ